MNILGVNSGRAAPSRLDHTMRRRLADGSAALLTDGRIQCAAIEERHRRLRYAGGFSQAAPAVLADASCAPEAVDAIGFSSCCDTPWTSASDRVDLLVEELAHHWPAPRLRLAWQNRVHLVDHHDSHAALAFAGSAWQRALVCVMDGFGNRLDAPDSFHFGSDWWRGSFDRQTFYVAEWIDGRMRLERVSESGQGAQEIGLAELYRAVTHYCGWPSYQYAGKTMALAGYGDWRALDKLSLAQATTDGRIEVGLANGHDQPLRQINEALRKAGYNPPRRLARPATPECAFLADLAAALQHQVEAALISAVSTHCDKYNIDKVAFAGGLAMNCIGLGRLARARPDLALYVPPAPGDTGQAAGNALWLAYAEGSPVREQTAPSQISSAALGPLYPSSHWRRAAEDFVAQRRGYQLECDLGGEALAKRAAAAVVEGSTVGLRAGRAEYGPRALGQCSILADPRQPDAQSKINAIKGRESFRPFAASVLSEDADACFPGAVASPFMSFAGVASDQVRNTAPGIVHIDGTTRYQTVAPDSGLFRAIIERTRDRSQLPLLLNTSFNIAGEPMAETPEEALDVFERTGLDALVLGNNWITRDQPAAAGK